MANKKYTLYFRGTDKNGNNHDMPIVSLPLKELDKYTSNYEDYNELFDNFPEEIKEFINNNLLYKNKNLNECFYITDYDYTPIMDVIFKKDSDVLFIEPNELEKLIEKNIMSSEEYSKSKLKSLNYNNVKKKYNFFSYLYYTYVKNNKIKCMIDLYYVNNKQDDDSYIKAIATDRVNLLVIIKKLSQKLESRRNLAYEFKKILEPNNIISEDLILYRRNIDNQNIKPLSNMIVNYDKFKMEFYKNSVE